MQTTRCKTINSLFIPLLTAMFLITLHAEAHLPRAREAEAVINTINCVKRTLTLNYPQGHGPQTVIWNSDTEFFRNGKTVSATELKQGTQITIYYLSPIWGEPFAIKIIWSASHDR